MHSGQVRPARASRKGPRAWMALRQAGVIAATVGLVGVVSSATSLGTGAGADAETGVAAAGWAGGPDSAARETCRDGAESGWLAESVTAGRGAAGATESTRCTAGFSTN